MTLMVSGGAYSISARFDHLSRLAHGLRTVARQLVALAGHGTAVTSNPGAFEAAALDPVGAAHTARAAVQLTSRCLLLAAEVETISGALDLAVIGYRGADRLDADLAPMRRAATDLPAALRHAGPELAAGATDPTRLLTGAQEILAADPDLADPALRTLGAVFPGPGPAGLPLPGGLVLPGIGAGSPVSRDAGLLSLYYRDGSPVVSGVPEADTDDLAGPPRGLGDVVRGLEVRNRQPGSGAIDVRAITTRHPDGTVTQAAIVDITGTRDWDVLRRSNPDVADFGTNLRGLGNRESAYEKGVIAAIDACGLPAGTPLMLVGHSQGGLVAGKLATDLAGHGLNITHVVTAGSPLGATELPPGVRVLSLENAGDVVPLLDAADNRTSAWQITVRVDHGGPGLGQRHSVAGAYLPGARDVDASTDPSVRDWLRSAGPFLTGTEVRTRAFAVARNP